MARFHRHEDYETPTVEAAEGFETYYGEDPGVDDLDARDAKRDFAEDEIRAKRQAEREGRA